MLITRVLIVCLIFISCKQNTLLDDFPIEVKFPLLDGDPLVISWNLGTADSIKLDTDVFVNSDTAYFYVLGTDAIRVRVYEKDEVIFDKHIRYQVTRGETFAHVQPQVTSTPISIAPGYLGFSFPLIDAIPLIGKTSSNNAALFQLIHNLYSHSKEVSIYINASKRFNEENLAFQSLSLLGNQLAEIGLNVNYSIEMPTNDHADFLKMVFYNLEQKFVKRFVFNQSKIEDEVKQSIESQSIGIANHQTSIDSNIEQVYFFDIGKWMDCKKLYSSDYSIKNILQEGYSKLNITNPSQSILNIRIPVCDEKTNSINTALWLMDFILEKAALGVMQVNVQLASPQTNSLFPLTFNVPKIHLYDVDSKREYPENFLIKSIHPIYYGIWMANDVLGNGNKMRAVTLDSAKSFISAYNFLTPENKPKYLVINHNDSLQGNIFINDSIIYRSWNARLFQIKDSTRDKIIYGGRYLTGSYDGKIRGTYHTDKIMGRQKGNFIPIAPSSAVIVQSKH